MSSMGRFIDDHAELIVLVVLFGMLFATILVSMWIERCP